MSSHLGANQTLALLTALKSTVQEFALREDRLNGGFDAKSTAETKAFEAAVSARARQVSEVMATEEAGLLANTRRAQATFARRKGWINSAHFNSRKRAMENIRAQEGRVNWQSAGRDTGRGTGTGKQAWPGVARQHQEWHLDLNRSREAFGALEAAAHSAFRGYGRFQRLLSPTREEPALDLSRDEQQLLGQLERFRAKTEEGLRRFKKMPLPKLFRFFPIWLQILLLLLGIVFPFAARDYLGLDGAVLRGIIMGFWVIWAVLAAVRQFVSAKPNRAPRRLRTAL